MVDLTSTADKSIGERCAVVGIRHHDHPLSKQRKQKQECLIADVLTSFHEDQRLTVAADGGPQPIQTGWLADEHCLNSVLREQWSARALQGLGKRNQQLREILGRRPEPPSRKFRDNRSEERRVGK